MKNRVHLHLAGALVCALLSSPIIAFADDHTICMGMTCGDGRRVRSDVKIAADADKNVGLYEGRACPKGIPLATAPKTLPKGHAFIGADKKQVVIPITDPHKELEDGDVLLSSYNTQAGGSPSALFFNGSGHAALVGTVGGKKYHLDSPKVMSGDFGKEDEAMQASWTVLRLRKYPPGVNTPEDLAKMQKDAPWKLEAWDMERKEILTKVKIYFDAMKESKYGYNTNYLETKVFDKPTREAWRAMLYPKDGGKGKCPVGSVYCSELPATGFALADENLAKKMPKGFFLIDAVNAFDDQIFQPELAKQKDKPKVGSKEWNDAFEVAWKKLTDDIGEGRPDELREFQKNEAEIKMGIKGLLALDKAQRPAVLALMTSKLPSLPIAPADLWHDIFRSDGIFSYAGSMISPRCIKTKTIVAAGEPDAGKETKIADPPSDKVTPIILPDGFPARGHGGGPPRLTEIPVPPVRLPPLEWPPDRP